MNEDQAKYAPALQRVVRATYLAKIAGTKRKEFDVEDIDMLIAYLMLSDQTIASLSMATDGAAEGIAGAYINLNRRLIKYQEKGDKTSKKTILADLKKFVVELGEHIQKLPDPRKPD